MPKSPDSPCTPLLGPAQSLECCETRINPVQKPVRVCNLPMQLLGARTEVLMEVWVGWVGLGAVLPGAPDAQHPAVTGDCQLSLVSALCKQGQAARGPVGKRGDRSAHYLVPVLYSS